MTRFLFQDEVIVHVFSQANPIRPQVKLARSATVRKIQDIIHQNYGTSYRVELFGSTSYGVDSPTSDLDLVIVVRMCFHLYLPASPNFDQDTNRMDGFPPSIDLTRLPRKHIFPPIDLSRTQCYVVRKLSTMSGPSQPGLHVPQKTEALITGT